MPSLHTSLAEARRQRGWSQAQLADRSGVSRAEVSAIETGRLVPSTVAALRLAAALGLPMENLFRLTPLDAKPDWAWPPRSDDGRLWEAAVGDRRLLFPVEGTAAGTLPHDGRAHGRSLESLPGAASAERTLVIAGCDPTVGLLVREVGARSGIRVLPLTRSSGDALELLRQGLVHVAGLHLGDENGRSRNESTVRHKLGRGYRLLHIVRWEEGVAVAPGRSKSVEALLRGRTRWVNREEGSGARRCLDRLLGSRRHPAGYERVVRDHRALAATISSGWAEAGICVRPVAVESRLNFLPVQRETYDLCFSEAFVEDPRAEALLAAVRSASYRLLLKDVPGWDAKHTGDVHAVA
jgi:molybdate-binding protein/transcriptional regulator with XRE-family HTH domain